MPLTLYNAIGDAPGPDLGDLRPPGWDRCSVLYAPTAQWPRDFRDYTDRRRRRLVMERVGAWAENVSDEPGHMLMVNVEESLRLPPSESRPGSFAHGLNQTDQAALARAFMSLASDALAAIRDKRPHARIGWFVQQQDAYLQAVAAMEPIYRRCDWLGVAWYLWKIPLTPQGLLRPWWRRWLTARLRQVEAAAPEPIRQTRAVFPVLNPQYHGGAAAGVRKTSLSRSAAAAMVSLADELTTEAVVWGYERDPSRWGEAVRGVANIYDAKWRLG